jgi:hypothetical protein
MNWRRLDADRFLNRSPIGLRLIDEFRGGPPIGAVRAHLEIDDGGGQFRAVDIAAVLTPSSVIVYPDLGRTSHPDVAPTRHYRVTLDADYYMPLYTATPAPVGTPSGLEFDAPPWNDFIAPSQPAVFVEVALLPAPNYPFESHYPVIHGIVQDVNLLRVPSALVARGGQERVLTDARGVYSLPLRWAQGPTIIDATDDAARTGSITVDVSDPNQRDRNQTITIN